MLLSVLSTSCGKPPDDEDRYIHVNIAQQAEWGKTPAEAYLDPVDRKIAETGKGLPGRPFPCGYDKNEAGVEVVTGLPTEQCVKMTSPKRWKGFWRNAFEGSNFCAAPAKECRDAASDENVWLDWNAGPEPDGALYEVEFIGRQTQYAGEYGHLGMSRHEIIVDRMLSIKRVEAGPPEPTEAKQKAWFEKCRKAGNCGSFEELTEMKQDKK